MKLWSHHPSTFKLDDAELRIDSTKGDYWNSRDPKFRARYREVLPKLQNLIGTDQFVWCCSKRGLYERTTEDIDLVEWELDVPTAQILRLYRVFVWEDIVWSRSDNWESLFCSQPVEDSDDRIGALIRVPLPPDQVRCLGPLIPRYPRRKSSSQFVRKK